MSTNTLMKLSPIEALASIKELPRPFALTGPAGWGASGYSYVSAAPFMTFHSTAASGVLTRGNETTHFGPDPFEALGEITKSYKQPAAPSPFTGGAVGYFSYDLKDVIEKSFRAKARDHYDAEQLCSFAFYDAVYVYDHNKRSGRVVDATGADTAASDGGGDRIREALSAPSTGVERPQAKADGPLRSNFTRDEYIEAVKKAKEYIAAGDIYQINLSQRLTVPYSGDPLNLFKGLIERSPAPFSSFIDTGGVQIISNTPERLMRVEEDTVETCPIKGTRPRGKTAEEDAALIEELRASTKERAEHVMIVDLERSDLGRISVAGSVEVTDFERVITYPGLHHMVSTVRGKLRPGVDALTALREAFPGGSITGAPKIRAMEIIAELEAATRGVYTGALGYVDFSGNLDFAMAIRTATLSDGVLTLPVGGGIVADSVPADEYDETILKARSFLDVIGTGGETGGGAGGGAAAPTPEGGKRGVR